MDHLRASYEKHIKNYQFGAQVYLSWFGDIISSGLTFEQSQQAQIDFIAKQMTNAGMQRFSKRLRLLNQDTLEPSIFWGVLTDLAIVAHSLLKIDRFSADLQYDLLVQSGLKQGKRILNDSNWKESQWVCLSVEVSEAEMIYEQKAFFQEISTGKLAYFSEFQFRRKTFDYHWTIGHTYKLKYQFYPSAQPMRIAISKANHYAATLSPIKAIKGIHMFEKFILNQLNKAPFFSFHALIATGFKIAKAEDGYILVDYDNRRCWRFQEAEAETLFIMFHVYQPLTLFMVWNNGQYEIKSVILSDQIIKLEPTVWIQSLS